MKYFLNTNKSKTLFSLLGLIALFLLLAIATLKEDPMVAPDEVVSINTAYEFIKSSELSETPFSSRLAMVDRIDYFIHGPLYYWLLAIPLKLFGFSLLTLRLTSVFFGVLVLTMAFFLGKQIFKNNSISLLIVFLLLIDYSFLRTVRLGRMEALVLFWQFLAYWLYFKFPKKVWLLSFVLALGVLTHFYLGVIPILVILIHRKFKKFFLLISMPVLAVFGWFSNWYFFGPKDLSAETLSHRIAGLNLDPIKFVFQSEFFIKSVFLIYFSSIFFAWFRVKKGKLRNFCLLTLLVTVGMIIFGSAGEYWGFLIFPTALSLMAARGSWNNQRLTKYNYLWFSFIFILLILNLTQQVRLNSYFSNCRYDRFSQKIADRLPQNSKVLLFQTIPTPYHFLAEKRKDLKLAYQHFHDYEQSGLKMALAKADYVFAYNWLGSELEVDSQAKFPIQDPCYFPVAIFELK